LASYIEEISNRKTNINWGGKSYRNSDVMFAVADISNIKKLFDWAPKVFLKEGIKLFLKNKHK
jgi:nucleoside-diphosphate-sugar epimerase